MVEKGPFARESHEKNAGKRPGCDGNAVLAALPIIKTESDENGVVKVIIKLKKKRGKNKLDIQNSEDWGKKV